MTQTDLQTARIPIAAETQGQRLVIEPWAEEYELEVGVHYVLEITGQRGGQPEIERASSLIIVYAWSGSTFRLLDQMQNVVLSSDLVVPVTAPGMSVHSFLKMISGQESISPEKENPHA